MPSFEDRERQVSHSQMHDAIARVGDARRTLCEVNNVHLTEREHAAAPWAGPLLEILIGELDTLTVMLSDPMAEEVYPNLDVPTRYPAAALALAAQSVTQAMAWSSPTLPLDHVLGAVESALEALS